jgi:hypothetical protein
VQDKQIIEYFIVEVSFLFRIISRKSDLYKYYRILKTNRTRTLSLLDNPATHHYISLEVGQIDFRYKKEPAS